MSKETGDTYHIEINIDKPTITDTEAAIKILEALERLKAPATPILPPIPNNHAQNHS
jgi:hypothetical protein